MKVLFEDIPVFSFHAGYQTAYSQLAFAGKKDRDPLGSDVPDPKVNLAKQLGKLATGHPGKVRANHLFNGCIQCLCVRLSIVTPTGWANWCCVIISSF